MYCLSGYTNFGWPHSLGGWQMDENKKGAASAKQAKSLYISKKIVKILQNFNKNLKNIFLTKWGELSLFSAMKNMHIWAGRVLI